MKLLFLIILLFGFKPTANYLSRKGYDMMPDGMKRKPYSPNINQMTTGYKNENTEYNLLKKRDEGATMYEYEVIQLAENKDLYVRDLISNGKTHLAKEAKKLKREIEMIKISPRENHINIHAKMKIKEQLIEEYKTVLKSAYDDAVHCHKSELHNAKNLVNQYKPLSNQEQERYEDLKKAEQKRQEEIRKYNRAIYASKWSKF